LYNTLILQPGTKAQGGTVTCTQNREFNSIYSDIKIVDWMKLKGNYGFKEYSDVTVTNPFPKGFVRDFTMVVVDSAQHLLSAAAGLAVLASLF
jgi:hypothetical protein